jgi:hypothetical protein
MIISFILFFINIFSFPQKPELSWKGQIKQNENGAILELKVKIVKDWYIYAPSQIIEGPVGLSLINDSPEKIEFLGDLIAISPREKIDEIWGGSISYFAFEGGVMQRINIKSKGNISVSVKAMVCSYNKGICIPINQKIIIKNP